MNEPLSYQRLLEITDGHPEQEYIFKFILNNERKTISRLSELRKSENELNKLKRKAEDKFKKLEERTKKLDKRIKKAGNIKTYKGLKELNVHLEYIIKQPEKYKELESKISELAKLITDYISA